MAGKYSITTTVDVDGQSQPYTAAVDWGRTPLEKWTRNVAVKFSAEPLQ